MLGRLVLLLLQIVIGWFGSEAVMGWLGGAVPGAFRVYVFAVVAAIVVFLVGVIAAQVLQGVGTPGSGTLTSSLFVAIIAALLWSFGPTLPVLSEVPWNRVPELYAVLGGAILGYHLRRW
ncbi:MAG: hypothetical protein AB7S70_06535 [Hyphomicrobium sp.]|uniref:hypothetical protein n=1 Tax=Hyphomicrobium sp. TaxID=82 RepID=UPI003D0A69FE